MVKAMGSLISGIICLVLAIISAVVFKRYIIATVAAAIAILSIFNAMRV